MSQENFFVALNANEQDIPTEIQLIPLGSIMGRDGRKFVNDKPDAILSGFAKNDIDLPIDYEHQSELDQSQRNGPAPAAGWIKALHIRDDGIWGKVEWTDRAKEMIKNREYRYISPTFWIDKSGRVMGLSSAGLVHQPNLHIKALSNQQQSAVATNSIAKALGLEIGSSEGDCVKAIQSLQTPDPEKYVPIEAVENLLKDRNSQFDEMRQNEAENLVEKAFNSNKITPAMKPWAIALCQQNPASFQEFIRATSADYSYLFVKQKFDQKEVNHMGADSDEALNISRQLGVDPEDLR